MAQESEESLQRGGGNLGTHSTPYPGGEACVGDHVCYRLCHPCSGGCIGSPHCQDGGEFRKPPHHLLVGRACPVDAQKPQHSKSTIHIRRQGSRNTEQSPTKHS